LDISLSAADDFDRNIRCIPRFHDPFVLVADGSFSSCWDSCCGGLKKAGEAVTGVWI
jgi:hypothetical protein